MLYNVVDVPFCILSPVVNTLCGLIKTYTDQLSNGHAKRPLEPSHFPDKTLNFEGGRDLGEQGDCITIQRI
jgi:hypothetical protein